MQTLFALFGTAIAAVPIALLKVIVGALLLLFGVHWLRKAMLRYAGVVAERDDGNLLKLVVGVMVSAFGIYWFGEGAGLDWRLGDATVVVLMALLLAVALVGTRLARRAVSR